MMADEEPEVVETEPQPAPAEAPVAPAAATGDVPQDRRHNGRKVREGIVSSAAMDKTVVVTVTSRVRHPLYRKTLQHTTKLYAHDADNTARLGDRVRVTETRPLSKLKRWRLLEVLERAK
jgi:small subunit ribosomal protein S17